jgi:hypothetical protein
MMACPVDLLPVLRGHGDACPLEDILHMPEITGRCNPCDYTGGIPSYTTVPSFPNVKYDEGAMMGYGFSG